MRTWFGAVRWKAAVLGPVTAATESAARAAFHALYGFWPARVWAAAEVV